MSRPRHVAWVIASRSLPRGILEVEASAAAEAAWVDTVMERSASVAGGAEKLARPAITTGRAGSMTATQKGSFFLGGPTEYADILEKWRSRDDFDGLEIRR